MLRAYVEVGMLIDPFITDLFAAYREIKIARQALLKKWRFDLLRAYAQQQDAYQRQVAERGVRKERYERALPFIGGILFLVCGIGAVLTFRSVDLACLGMFLMLGTGFGALLAYLPWAALSHLPPPPENPVTRTSNDEEESALRKKLFPRLVPLWRREMALPIPTYEEADRLAEESGKWGLLGELDLIRALEAVVSADTYILHSIRPTSGDDLDVVLIGPKGFWYFEVKHWNAQFVWEGGAWQVWQFDYSTRAPQPVPLRETPDAQWARMRDEVLANLRASKGDLLKKAPVLGNLQGGIVFSNPNAVIEIDRTAPFRYGTIEQWIVTYRAAPRLKDMTPGRSLQLVEVLLKRHQSFTPEVPLRSMKDAIPQVIAEVEEGIRAWIDSP